MSMSTIMFNCGKLYHIATIKDGIKACYTDDYISDHARKAMEVGIAHLKVDGECTSIHREQRTDGTWWWRFYRRQDNYKGTEEVMALPDGMQPDIYTGGGKPHHYVLLPVSPDLTTGKGKRRSAPGPDTYAAIAKGVEIGMLPDPASSDAPEWISCEWIGTKHQSNVDGVPFDHGLVPHCEPFTPRIECTSLADFSELAREECIEGLVYLHPDGTRYKMRCNMVNNNKWDSEIKKKKPADPGVTTIRPKVLTRDGLIEL